MAQGLKDVAGVQPVGDFSGAFETPRGGPVYPAPDGAEPPREDPRAREVAMLAELRRRERDVVKMAPEASADTWKVLSAASLFGAPGGGGVGLYAPQQPRAARIKCRGGDDLDLDLSA